jgi:hypothetical protein
MAITVHCECGVKLQVKDEFAGQEGRCPKCQRTLHIPSPNQALDVLEVAEPSHYEVREVESERTDRDRDRDNDRRDDQQQEPVTDHGGDQLPSTMDFFVDPPREIGPVVSACSTLAKGVEPWSPGARAGLVLFVAALGLILGLMIAIGFGIREVFWAAFWPILLTIVLALIAWAVTIFSHTVTFVGRDGLARFGCSGNRDNVSSTEIFHFADAQDLRTRTVHHYTNGVYQNTQYTYTWTDINGVQRFAISGSHNSENSAPPSQHPFHFARAGEIAWSNFLLNLAYRQIELGNPIRFNLSGGDWIKLGKESIEFKIGGTHDEWPSNVVSSVRVNAGQVQIRHRDAQEGWFSSSGIVKFQYDQLANAQLFFFVMERIVGIPING